MMPKNNIESSNILVLIVLYKCPLADSQTLISILNQDECPTGFRYIIWDNSPHPISNAEQNELRSQLAFEYISRPENTPLSKVYNEVIENNKFDYILLLDQDSGIPKSYFNEIALTTNNNPDVSLFLPIVKNRDLIVSPGKFQFFKGKHWKFHQTGLMKARNMLAVTSGMLISNSYFVKHHYKFDERLDLYGIDSKFMIEYGQNEAELFVIPTTFAHNSALWSNPSAETLLPRFRNVKKAWSIILADKPVAKLLNSLHSRYSSVRLAVKYRDIRFLY